MGREVASAGKGTLRRHPLREGDRRVDQVAALDDLVDEADPLRLRGADGIAADDHLQRFGYADEAGQPLRAAGPRENPELDLGKTALRVTGRDPVVAPERHLEPAAEGRPVEGGDDGLRAGFQARDDRVEPGILRRLAELRDVGARDERASGPRDDHRAHVGVGERALERFDQPLAHGMAERVDRRIVHHDEPNGAPLLQTHDFAHGARLS